MSVQTAFFFAVTLRALVLASEWSYDNITAWDYLENSYCSGTVNNTEYPQSPINIDTSAVINENNCSLEWDVSVANDSFEILNTGHSLQLIPVELRDMIVENYLTSNTLSIARLTTDSTSVTNTDEQFCLHSFHFHWGTNSSVGSEHTIDNVQFPLEGHFVHFLCNYSSLSDAISAGKTKLAAGDENPYTLAVIGVLYELQNDTQSTSYSVFDAIFDAIDNSSVTDEKNSTSSIFVSDLDLSDLVTGTLKYYTYEGSLTTPLCIPIVRWYVLQNTMAVSAEQMMKFRDSILDENLFRNVQSLVDGAYVSECDVDDETTTTSTSSSTSTVVNNESTDGFANVILAPIIISGIVVLLLVVLCLYCLKTKTEYLSCKYSFICNCCQDSGSETSGGHVYNI